MSHHRCCTRRRCRARAYASTSSLYAPRVCVYCARLCVCCAWRTGSQGALVQKWAAARAEADAEEILDAEAEQPESLAVLEQRKRKRLAEWKDGLSAEEAARNTNFVEVAGDWRERVARARKDEP